MKNILFLSVLFILIGCKPSGNTDLVTEISGQLKNSNAEKISLTDGKGNVTKMDVDSLGMFSQSVPNLEEGYYTFKGGSESSALYIVPGSPLKITVDINEFDESIMYEGSHAGSSNYLAKKYMEEENQPMSFKEMHTLEEAEFTTKVDELTQQKIAFLNAQKGLSDNFINKEKKSIEYSKLSYISGYEDAHAYFTKKEDYKASDRFNAPLEGLKFDSEEDFTTYSDYKSMVMGHYMNDDVAVSVGNLDNISSPIIKQSLLDNLKYYLSPSTPKLESIYNSMIGHASDEEYKKELGEKFELFKNLVEGKPSPGFDYVDIDGNNVSLESLKGKNVYIDVWATWCGPCKAEIPSLKALEKEYHGKNVEFVSISVDKSADKEKWEKMVNEKELKGVQLFSDKDWKSDFVVNYGIDGIPRFIVVDDKGAIVSADAPRPSSDTEIKEMLNGLNL